MVISSTTRDTAYQTRLTRQFAQQRRAEAREENYGDQYCSGRQTGGDGDRECSLARDKQRHREKQSVFLINLTCTKEVRGASLESLVALPPAANPALSHARESPYLDSHSTQTRTEMVPKVAMGAIFQVGWVNPRGGTASTQVQQGRH